MTVSQAAKEEWEEQGQDHKAFDRSFAKTLIDALGIWRRCGKVCQRARGCTDAAACAERYSEEILNWQRECLLPYLRKRYPSVQWGAGSMTTGPQIEAALAAEARLSATELDERTWVALKQAEAQSATSDAEEGA